VRRLISILLLATFVLPFLSALSALGETSESRLLACCRRNGAHHCMMSAEQKAQLEIGRHVTTIHSKCPLFPGAVPAEHHPTPHLPFTTVALRAVSSRPAQDLPALDWIRTAVEGARHKRGPPVVRHSLAQISQTI
jgi:hypothetical protein